MLPRGPNIRHAGVVLDAGDAGKKYAAIVKRIVDGVALGLEEVNESNVSAIYGRKLRRPC